MTLLIFAFNVSTAAIGHLEIMLLEGDNKYEEITMKLETNSNALYPTYCCYLLLTDKDGISKMVQIARSDGKMKVVRGHDDEVEAALESLAEGAS